MRRTLKLLGLIGAAGQVTAALTALGSGWLYGAYGAPVLFGGAAALMTLLLVAGLHQGAALIVPAPAHPSATPEPG